MGKGPCLYSEIGKKARDLLYKDYNTDQKFTVTTFSPTGVTITSSGTKKDEFFLADVNTQIKNKNLTTDLKVDTFGNLFTTVTIDEAAPGLKAILSVKVPDHRTGKLELQYLREYAALSASVAMAANPTVNVSGVVGSNVVSLGTDLSVDTSTGKITKLNTGMSFSQEDLIASLTVNDKGGNMTASYYHLVGPLTAVGAEVNYVWSTAATSVTLGTQHALDPLTTVKARINNNGKASALIQHEWRPKSLFTVSGEIDSRAVEKATKVGLSLVLKA